MSNVVDVSVRDSKFQLLADNRSLLLCSRMNYETENLDFIDSLNEGDTYYDIGACEGRFSIYAASRGLKVFAFEPESKNFAHLSKNIQLNQGRFKYPVRLFNLAVSNQDGNGTIKIGQPWAGGHQKVVENEFIRTDLDFDFVESQTVRLQRLDTVLKNENLPAPTALKIDVDGSEYAMILGAQLCLGTIDLKQILIELLENDEQSASTLKSIMDAGFKIKTTYPIPNEPLLKNYWLHRE